MLDRASRTAADVAAVRALCSIAPPNQRILHDALSLQMIPPPWQSWRFILQGPFRTLTYHVLRGCAHLRAGVRGMCDVVALRYRYIDDRLAEAYAQGFRQILLLGAGFDYRAYRPAFADTHFIEVDHPATQAAKLAILNAHQITVPSRVHYIAVDFMGDWAATLSQSKALADVPTFVIWEGVAYYLDHQAVRYTLQTLTKQLAPGSRLIFDCAQLNTLDSRAFQRAARYATSHGEPLLWGGTPQDIAALIREFQSTPPTIKRFSDILHTLRQAEHLVLESEPVFDQFYMVETRVG
ncbi:methyltransferase (TIGR00027 family) [Chitinivorax tropicus]|uniref:S-adenosyl-L-methionine-dependent methyltransferase n=1 Tax=Chitinivorax tropicus TaxID=714531 RepID=A0A840MRD1_9PROT|nr:SAM-dependent methyltransferase [Chitinivorax tropicus]MBB5019985.1 methyltransferase (TIGR00027 family) [Chitinivorax tropicus]